MEITCTAVTHNSLQSEHPGQWREPARTEPRCSSAAGCSHCRLQLRCSPFFHLSLLKPVQFQVSSVSGLARIIDLGMGIWPRQVKWNRHWTLLGKGHPFPWRCWQGARVHWLGGRQPKTQSDSTAWQLCVLEPTIHLLESQFPHLYNESNIAMSTELA